mmetsp:Transcript_79511/g.184537  ORF Transcript_79511/g.184537 Transcript_79511/m.184537 type:complete len:84 (+) Transcript_79511:435-686(+)
MPAGSCANCFDAATGTTSVTPLSIRWTRARLGVEILTSIGEEEVLDVSKHELVNASNEDWPSFGWSGAGPHCHAGIVAVPRRS